MLSQLSLDVHRAINTIKFSDIPEGFVLLRLDLPTTTLFVEGVYQTPAILVSSPPDPPLLLRDPNNAFHKLPHDVVYYILSLLPSKEILKCAVLSKELCWFASSNRLWQQRIRTRCDSRAFFTDPSIAKALWTANSYKEACLIYEEKYKNGSCSGHFVEMRKLLRADQCRFIIAKFPIALEDGPKKSMLLYMLWAGVDTKVREKMIYASCVPQLKARITNIDMEVQICTEDELEVSEILDHIHRKVYPHAKFVGVTEKQE